MVKSSSQSRMLENLDSVNLKLDQEAMDAISQLNRNKDITIPVSFEKMPSILSIQYMNELDFLYKVQGLSEFSFTANS